MVGDVCVCVCVYVWRLEEYKKEDVLRIRTPTHVGHRRSYLHTSTGTSNRNVPKGYVAKRTREISTILPLQVAVLPLFTQSQDTPQRLAVFHSASHSRGLIVYAILLCRGLQVCMGTCQFYPRGREGRG